MRMTRDELEDELTEAGALVAVGLEDALIGVGTQFNRTFAVYDRAKAIEILARDMGEEDAEEFFDFNVAGAWVGEQTPVFVTLVAP